MRALYLFIILTYFGSLLSQKSVILQNNKHINKNINLANKIVFVTLKNKTKKQVLVTGLQNSTLYFLNKVSKIDQNKIAKTVYCLKCNDKINQDSLFNSLVFILKDSLKISEIKKFQVNFYKEKPLIVTELLSYPVGVTFNFITFYYIANAGYFNLKLNGLFLGTGTVLFGLYYKTFRHNLSMKKWTFKQN